MGHFFSGTPKSLTQFNMVHRPFEDWWQFSMTTYFHSFSPRWRHVPRAHMFQDTSGTSSWWCGGHMSHLTLFVQEAITPCLIGPNRIIRTLSRTGSFSIIIDGMILGEFSLIKHKKLPQPSVGTLSYPWSWNELFRRKGMNAFGQVDFYSVGVWGLYNNNPRYWYPLCEWQWILFCVMWSYVK
jgi:hypothetical protein